MQERPVERLGAGARRAHEPAIDGLRGLAALIVVLRHCFNAQIWPPELRLALAQSPLALLLNKHGAVQLFFVLSGFVLAASLFSGFRLVFGNPFGHESLGCQAGAR